MHPGYYMPIRDYRHRPQHHPQHHPGGGGISPVLPFLAGLAGGGLLFSVFSGPGYGPSPYGQTPYSPAPYGPSPYGQSPYSPTQFAPGYYGQ